MNKIKKALTMLALLPIFIFTSCSTTGGSSQSGVLPVHNAESKIRKQAIGTGAGAGFTIGMLSELTKKEKSVPCKQCAQCTKGNTRNCLRPKKEGPNIGSALVRGGFGALIGAAGGAIVGEIQVKNLRGQRVKTTKLAAIAEQERAHNAEIIAYNKRLSLQISQLKGMQANKRAALAKKERKRVEASIQNLRATQAKRRSYLASYSKAKKSKAAGSSSSTNANAARSIQSSIAVANKEEVKLQRALISIRSYEA